MLTKYLLEHLASPFTQSHIGLQANRCLRSRLSSNTCTLCIDNCPANALNLSGRSINWTKDSCTDCMKCVSICPVDVFAFDVDMHGLINKAGSSKKVQVCCEQIQQAPEDFFIIPCVGIFSDEMLLTLVLLTDCRVEVDTSKCLQCANSPVYQKFTRQLESISKRFSQKSTKQFSIISSQSPTNQSTPKTDRRSYLHHIKTTAVSLTKESFSPEKKQEKETKSTSRISPGRNLLLQHLLQNVPSTVKRQLGREFCYKLVVQDHCTLCPLCKGICPTGAIGIIKKKNTKQLVFRYKKCIGCGLCSNFCKQKALALQPFGENERLIEETVLIG